MNNRTPIVYFLWVMILTLSVANANVGILLSKKNKMMSAPIAGIKTILGDKLPRLLLAEFWATLKEPMLKRTM